MLDNLILNKTSIESIYATISEFHEKYLKQYGVKLPKLYDTEYERRDHKIHPQLLPKHK